MKIFDAEGNNNSITKIDYILVVIDLIPKAIITLNSNNLIVGENISLSYQGDDGNGLIYMNWSFGDNSYSNEINPVHIYKESGNYTIILYIIDQDFDKSSTNMSIFINSDLKPVADFGVESNQIISFYPDSIKTIH